MRFASTPVCALLASLSLLAAPVALAQSTEKQQPKAAATTAVKPAPKAADADKASKVQGATSVRTTPADTKKSGEKDYDGCSHGKTAASDV